MKDIGDQITNYRISLAPAAEYMSSTRRVSIRTDLVDVDTVGQSRDMRDTIDNYLREGYSGI